MKLITLNIDESILSELLEKLKEYPEDKLQINEDAVIRDASINDIVEELDDFEDTIEDDYFMLDDDNNLIEKYEVEIIGMDEDDDEDDITQVSVKFESGKHYWALVMETEDFINDVKDIGYCHVDYIIMPKAEKKAIEAMVEDMIYSRIFLDAFNDNDDYDFDDEDDPNLDLDDVDPVRFN